MATWTRQPPICSYFQIFYSGIFLYFSISSSDSFSPSTWYKRKKKREALTIYKSTQATLVQTLATAWLWILATTWSWIPTTQLFTLLLLPNQALIEIQFSKSRELKSILMIRLNKYAFLIIARIILQKELIFSIYNFVLNADF